MEPQEESTAVLSAGDDGTLTLAALKDLRHHLETRIEARRATHNDLVASLQTLIPNLVSSLNLSLSLISSFNRKPFSPIPNPNPNQTRIHTHSLKRPHEEEESCVLAPNLKKLGSEAAVRARAGKIRVGKDCGGGSKIVRSMVARVLLEREPWGPIDTGTILRKIENSGRYGEEEKGVMRELGGEYGAEKAVEIALREIEEEGNGVVELEREDEGMVGSGGKCRLMVMGIDRMRLVRELPEKDRERQIEKELSSVEANKRVRGSGDANGDGFGMMPRPPQSETWPLGPWDPHMGGMPPMFPGPGGRGMGLLAVPRGVGIVPPLRGPFGPGSPLVSGANGVEGKQNSEEEVMKDLEALLNKKSFRELQKSKTGEELMELIHRPTARETAVAEKFKTKDGPRLKEYCSALTKEDCRSRSGSYIACEKVHFRRIIAPHTDVNLGDCSFLDTCRHMKTCKYVHYELDPTDDVSPMMGTSTLHPSKALKPQQAHYCSEVELGQAQWINCDIRSFRMDILGQFGVIMADPPWDIHMELPYGTMADTEMKTLNVPALQTDGLIFLWVTGRAMELGRDCLELWGYKRVEEIIWVKTNQLQRIIRTGRTGHWLNHSKEHCLVGIKGNPEVNRNIDTDVIVAEVRETSRKPDEMYAMLERISPRTRKLELFARMHNTHAGWLSLGNQLNGVHLVDEGLRARFRAAYPDVEIRPPSPPQSSAMEVESNAARSRIPFEGNFKPPPVPPPQFTLPSTSHGIFSVTEEKPMVQTSRLLAN